MKKDSTKKLITGVIIALAVLILSQLFFYVQIYIEKKANHEKVVRLINEDLSFSWDTMDEDLLKINKWIDTGHFTNEDLGRLYERASLIYMQKGETMSYYRYLGYAICYLQKSSEQDYTINVYLDLANFFLNNYSEENAGKMMDAASQIKDFDNINDLQIKSYAFRMKGIWEIINSDYVKAEEYLLKAQEAVDLSDTGVFEECYTSINDVWLARVYYETGRYDECEEKLLKWEGHEMFTGDVYRQILLRDLIVPYHQVKCLLTTAKTLKGDEPETEEVIRKKEAAFLEAYEEFMTLCEENGYEKAELNTLLQLQREFPPVTDTSKDLMIKKLQSLYTVLFDEQNSAYTDVINGTVTDAIHEREKQDKAEEDYALRLRLEILITIGVLLILSALVIMIQNGRIDGVTGLLTRREFNRALSKIKRGNSRYGIIMIDIDHFKSINDTYGHQSGDMVLGRLGQLIGANDTGSEHGYRYGGEEFAIILERHAVAYAEKIAEKLRLEMEVQKWPFDKEAVITISLGVAAGEKDGVLKQADDNLYLSKKNGRNRITSSLNR